MTDRPDETPDASSDAKPEAPQAMHVFTEDPAPDVRLDPDNPAFDKVQGEHTVDDEYEAEYNRRYVKAHGDHRGNDPAPDA